MSEKISLPPDEVMRQMAKLAMEQATSFFARMADDLAANPAMKNVSGTQALHAFAEAIRSTNARVWPAVGSTT